MPPTEVLLILAVVGLVLGLPLAALLFALGARNRSTELQSELRRLTDRLNRLEARIGAPNQSQAAPSNVPLTVTPLATACQPDTAADRFRDDTSLGAIPPTPSATQGVEVSALDHPHPEPAPLPPVLGHYPEPSFTVREPKAPEPAFTPSAPTVAPIDWERFLGVKLLAWIGTLVLFLGVAFALKYSFDRGWISPTLRVALGFCFGLGLVGGGLRLARPPSVVTGQVLCASGILVLYADIFAANSFYHLIPSGVAFLLMALATVSAFLIAVRLNAASVAVLGLVGGFLTPPLLSTGVDRPFALFSYVALLDVGLAAVALRGRWHYLLVLGVLGTLLTQWGWVGHFLNADKVTTGLGVYTLFASLFAAACGLAQRRGQVDNWIVAAPLAAAASAYLFVASLCLTPEAGYWDRPGLLFASALVVDAGLLALVWLQPTLKPVQLATGMAVFGLLALWTIRHLTESFLGWALGLSLGFGVLHTLFAFFLDKRSDDGHPAPAEASAVPVYPTLALAFMLLPALKLTEVSLWLWPAVLAADALLVVAACQKRSLVGVLFALLLTMATLGAWILRLPNTTIAITEPLLILVAFAVIFYGSGLYVLRRFFADVAPGGGLAASASAALPGAVRETLLLADQLPAMAALLPFLLLATFLYRLPLPDPTPVFIAAALLLGLLLTLVRFAWAEMLSPVALLCVLLVENGWHSQPQARDVPGLSVAWYLFFYAVFHAFPFVFSRRLEGQKLPFIVAALAGPCHFLLAYGPLKAAYVVENPGLIPFVFALPYLLSVGALSRAEGIGQGDSRLAWHGGVALFFITLIFPIQFERQWLTIGWALEGAALVWLYWRVPHAGLPRLGVALLVTVFVRLALNPAVYHYQPRSETPFWNWFLYAYGLAILSLFAAAHGLKPPYLRWGRWDARALLRALGTTLAFILMNIEIADRFSTGRYIAFEFSGSLERDLAYSLAWAAFAFVLLVVGIGGRLVAPRYAGLALLMVTLLKLFFQDLWRLGGLYRIGSLVGLALVLIPVSYLYQRFLAPSTPVPANPPKV